MSLSEDPNTHSDGSNGSDDQEQQEVTPRGAKKFRSPRACVACRRMKTRCEIDEALGDACKLCIRARRQCIMQTIPRRRRPKTKDRVADLERKIDTLTALLATNASTKPTDPNAKAAVIEEASPDQPSESTPSLNASDSLIREALNNGLLDWDTACGAFDRYSNEMCRFFPFIVFPPSSSADSVREQQPILFFTIITVALFSIQSTAAVELIEMLTKELSLRVVYKGERSLELVQALLVYTTYYAKPKPAQELNFNQMVHIASTMALDIGLGRRSHKTSSIQRTDLNQLESLASRRAWLGCYYLGTSASMSLRHPAFVRWSVYIEECLDVLSSDAQALPSDAWLCDLVRLQHIAEDASVMFSMDDPGSLVTLNDPKTRYQIGVFRQQLEHWRRYCKTDRTQPYVRLTEAGATLYIHEIAMHCEHNIDEFRPPMRPVGNGLACEEVTSPGNLEFLPARIESLFTCLEAIHACFDAMLSMDLKTLCALPNMFFVRTGYAAWALRKLLRICRCQTHAKGQFSIGIEDLKFEQYLTPLIELLARVHAQNNSHVVRAFYIVMTQIKAQELKSSKDPHSEGFAAEIPKAMPRNDGFSVHHAPHRRPLSSSIDTPSTSESQRLHPTGGVDHGALGPESAISFEQVQLDAPIQQAPQQDLPLWIPGDFDPSVMASIEALQWLDQDFAFEDVPMYGIDDINQHG